MKNDAFVLVLSLLFTALAGCSSKQAQVGIGGPKTVQAQTSIDCEIEGGVSAVAVSKDGRLAITQGYGETKNVQIWNIEKKTKLHEFDNSSGSVLPVAMAADGNTAAYATYNYISLRDVVTGNELRKLSPKGHGLGFPKGLRFSSAGDLLLVAGGGYITGWNPATGEEILNWRADEKEVTALSNLFDGEKEIASGNEAGIVTIWEVASGKLLKTLTTAKKEKIVCIAGSPDGKTLVTASVFGPVEIWDRAGGMVSSTIKDAGSWVFLLILPDGKTLLYSDRGNNLNLADLGTGVRNHVLEGHKKQVWSLSVTADGGTLVSGSDDKTLKVWNLNALP